MNRKPPASLEPLLPFIGDGRLDGEQKQRLAHLIATDEDCRAYYIDYITMNAMLEFTHGSLPAAEAEEELPTTNSLLLEVLEQEQEARIRREQQRAIVEAESRAEKAARRESMRRLYGLSEPVDTGNETRHYVIPRPLFYGGIAAVVVVMAAIIWPMLQANPSMPDGSDTQIASGTAGDTQIEFVAELDSSVDAQWGNDQIVKDGQLLPKGIYKLKSGILKIVYESGAEIIIEGPASFTLNSDTKLSMNSGRLAGLCPTEASRGFVVQLPNVQLTDLGTEFGVLIDQDGAAETHVYDGEVEVAPIINNKVIAERSERLMKGDARLIDRTGNQITSIAARDLAVIRTDEFSARQMAEASAYHRWLAYRYTMQRDSSLLAYYAFDAKSFRDGRALNIAARTVGKLDASLGDGRPNSDPISGADRFGGREAMRFNREMRQSLYVHDWPEVGALEALTISCWYRIDDPVGWPMLVTQWNDEADKGDKYCFHLSLRVPSIAQDPLSRSFALQTHLSIDGEELRGPGFDIKVEGRSDERVVTPGDGWNHVVLTVECGGAVRMYKNGVEVDADNAMYRPLQLPVISQPLVIGGKAVSQDYVNQNLSYSIYFDGWMDDVALYSRALDEDEVLTMYRAGSVTR